MILILKFYYTTYMVMYMSTFVINITKRFTGFTDKLIFAFRHNIIVSDDGHIH